MRTSEALQANFERKVAGAIEPLIQASSPIRVTFLVEHDLFKIHVELHARDHSLVEVKEASDDMQKTIDLAVETLFGILSRSKDKQVQHHGQRRGFPAPAMRGTESPASSEDNWLEDDGFADGEDFVPAYARS
jgi:ribosome-associated translation inhibitor RaiA